MKRDRTKYFENWWELFASAGWKQLCDQVKSNLPSINKELDKAADLHSMGALQGAKSELVSILTLKTRMENAYAAEIQNEKQEAENREHEGVGEQSDSV